MSDLSFDTLKSKHREIREDKDKFPEDLSVRVHRAMSWLKNAEEAADDDAKFIFLWISFNAAYAQEIGSSTLINERSVFKGFFDKLLAADGSNRIYNAILNQFLGSAKKLMANQYVFEPFWKHQNGVKGYKDWKKRLSGSQRHFNDAVLGKKTELVLSLVFDRLYVLRNQLIHGGATHLSSVNRTQLKDGTEIMSYLVPVFIDVIMDSPLDDWGKPYYPVVSEDHD